MNRALILAFVSTSALASSNYTQDARDLSAAALCGATNTSCQTGYKTGATSTAASKRLEAAYRAIRAAEVPPPPPAPPPSPPPPAPALSGVTSEGDSISVLWSGNHVGIWKASRPDVTLKSLAVGGSGLNNLIARKANIGTPKVFTVLIGANDLTGYASGKAYADAVVAYVGPVRATGAKVAVGTILPQVSTNSAYQLKFDAYRAEYNATIKASPAIDAVIDFGAPQLQADGVHPTDAGQAAMAPAYKAVVDALLAGQTVPPPSPPPAPPPVDTTLHPLAFVPSPDVDINTELVPAWGTGAIPPKGFTGATPNLDDPGAFRFVCAPAGLNYDDPIVYPNQPGKSHLHQYYGNTAITAASTYASIRTTGTSTCNSPLNRSGYWEPAMLTGTGMVVRPDVNALYYKRYPKTHPFCTAGNSLYQGECVPIPTGLRMVFGFNMLTMTAGGGYYNCVGPTATQAHYPASQNGLRTAAAVCGPGNQLGMIISAPDCWDGKNLDSADHRAHMSNMKRDPNTGQMKCPSTHPKVIPQLTLGVWYSVGPEGANTWELSSDTMVDGSKMVAGSTFHADYFEGWDERVKLMWEDNCINLRLNCSGGDLGNGKQLKMFSGFSIKANPRLVPVPVRP